jgi:chaperonin GroES
MSKIKLRPLDDRVVVEPLEAEQMTAGGIVLPDAAQEKPQRGKVIATGPGKLLDSGNRGELSVKIGDEVIFGKYGGSEVEVDGEEYKILRESDILAKVVSEFELLTQRRQVAKKKHFTTTAQRTRRIT